MIIAKRHEPVNFTRSSIWHELCFMSERGRVERSAELRGDIQKSSFGSRQEYEEDRSDHKTLQTR